MDAVTREPIRAVAFGGPARPRASWLDWLQARIDALPGPLWLAYVLMFGLLLAIDVGTHWAAGDELGEIAPLRIVESSFPVILLVGMAWLDGVASKALDNLRPALAIPDADVESLRWALTHTPAGWAAVAALIGIGQGLASILTSPAGYGLSVESPLILWAGAAFVRAGTTVVAFAFIAHAIHQLRLVRSVHRDLATIDVFRLDPLYAFASLTSWTGIWLLGFVTYGFLAFSIVGDLTFSVIDVVTTIGFCLLGVVLFVVPLIGLHDRIQAEKSRQRAIAGQSMAAAVAELNRRMAAGDFVNSKEVTDALVAATSAYTTISRIPTWPWRQETLRGFLGAAALPLVLWAATAVLGRVLPG